MMTIGIAAVTTNVIISGSTSISGNPDDFDVYFSDYVDLGDIDTEYVDATVSVYNGRKITFSGIFDKLDDTLVINFWITNASKNYDAEVGIDCSTSNTYLDLSYAVFNPVLDAMTTDQGHITVSLVKSYVGDSDIEAEISCTLNANAVEINTQGSGSVSEPLETSFDVGAEIALGAEKFNVISDNGDTVTMLAQYNLGSNYRQSIIQHGVSFSDINGWEYTPGPKEIDIQEWSTNPKLYINEYIEFLKNETNDLSLSGDLITLNQLELLSCGIPSDYNYPSDENSRSCLISRYSSWLVNGQNWWTRSAFSTLSDRVWGVYSSGLFGGKLYDDLSFGIRPVITISKAALEGKLITFAIEGVSYNAIEGMTWGEWVDSSYNTAGLVLSGASIVDEREYKVYNSTNGLVITSNNYINSGSSYKFTKGYSSQ